MEEEIQKIIKLGTLETIVAYNKEVWKAFVKSKGGRAGDDAVEFYSYLKNLTAKIITKETQ